MAKKRMFSLDVVETDSFINLPPLAQLLYFHLSMYADDEGFVDSPQKTARMCKIDEEELKPLINKGFIIPFESGVIVITHWKVNNNLIRRFKKTRYSKEKATLEIDENDTYIKRKKRRTDNVRTKSVQSPYNVRPSIDKYSIDEYSIDKNSIDKSSINTNLEDNSLYSNNTNSSDIVMNLPLIDGSYHHVTFEEIQANQKLFPTIDAMKEYRKMLVWLEAHPDRQKNKNKINEFVTDWFIKNVKEKEKNERRAF